jgi:PAS domain S-box-containing protein
MGEHTHTPRSGRDSGASLSPEHLSALQAAFDSVPFAVWARDRNGRIVLQNTELVRIWGNQLGKLPEDSDAAPDVIRSWEKNNRRALAGRTTRGEAQYRVNGEVRVFHDIVAPLRMQQRVVGIIGFLVDITDHKRTEAALLESRMSQELALEGGGMGTWDLDLVSGRVTWDKRQFELHGLQGNGASMDVNESWERMHPDDRRSSRKDFEKQLACGGKLENEFRILLPDGGTRWLAARARVIRDGSGKPVRVIGVNFDITERKRAEAAMRRLQQQAMSAAELERQNIGRDLHDGLGQLLSGLAFCAGALHARLTKGNAAEAADAAQIAEHLRSAVAQTRGLAAVLHPIEPEPDGLANGIRALCGTVSDMFRIDCLFERQRALPISAPLVANHLFRIAQESIQNAVRHGGANRIRVNLRKQRDSICLTVRDNGVGLSPADPQREGMGLPTMRYRAEAMGGTLTIKAGREGGTVVTCIVPAVALLRNGD